MRVEFMNQTNNVRHVDPVMEDLWHAICAIDEIQVNAVQRTTLFEQQLSFTKDEQGTLYIWRAKQSDISGRVVTAGELTDLLPVQSRYGYLWTCVGTPSDDIFSIPEYEEDDRRNLNAASIGVHVSAPRAIENFLDMGHFPYVHTNILGVEPHTEVKEYDVQITENQAEILATRCLFYQPMASASSESGADVEYVYRVPHPYCAVLYKSSPVDESRMDVIAVFLQPIDEEHIRAHMLLSVLDTEHDNTYIRKFQQTIFGQDKPILENQFPKRLPLDPRAETPIRADKSAIAYRRWLRGKKVTYGVYPSAD